MDYCLLNPRGGTVSWAWDARDRLVSVTHGTERVGAFAYDAEGRLLSTEDRLGTTRFAWDDGDRLVGIRWSDALALAIEHDAIGRITRRRLPGGLDVVFTRDPLTDRPVRVAFGAHFLSDTLISWTLTLLVITIVHHFLFVRPLPGFGEAALEAALTSAGRAIRRMVGLGPKT